MAIDARQIKSDAVTALCQELVRIPSISGSEGAIADLLQRELSQLGLDVLVDDYGNVIGRMGPTSDKTLLFDGHMDTVTAMYPETWTHAPFGGELANGAVYGRGSTDMKGSIASMVAAIRALVEGGFAPNGQLVVAFVVQEEPCEGAAIGHVLEGQDIHPDWVVLGEPTHLQLARGHRGRLEIEINVQGKACHAASPSLGVNAIYGASRLIVGLEIQSLQLGTDDFLGRGTFAVTDISSSAASRNAVPELCQLLVDRRLTAGETEAMALAEIRRIAAREDIQATIDVAETVIETYKGGQIRQRQSYPAWATPATSPLVKTVASVVENALGFVPRISRWEFSTDGVYTAGQVGIPTVGFGPGDEKLAHAIDEHVAVKDMAAAALVYARLAERLLS